MKTNKKIKVLCASVMALSVIGTSLPSVFANNIPTEKELIELDRNIVKNNSFELDAQNWNMVNAQVINETNNKVGKINKTNDSNANAHIWQEVTLKRNTKYVLTADIKVVGEKDVAVSFDLKKGNVNNPVYFKNVMVNANSNWQKGVKLEFDTGDQDKFVIGLARYKQNASQALKNSEAYIDNVKLVEASTTPSNYEILWADDFNGSELDKTNWGYELGCIRGVEQQHYVADKENVYLEKNSDGKGGHLVLKATDRDKEDQYDHPRDKSRRVIYNSGSIRTHGKKDFLYGRLEMRAKLPKGKGVFPAFWTLGLDGPLGGRVSGKQGYGWARCGEIDIMELTGQQADNSYGNRTVYQTVHTDYQGYKKYAGTAYTINEEFNNDYHVFGIDWYPDRLEWYVDGKIVSRLDYNTLNSADRLRVERTLNRPQYIQLNLAMGGEWPGLVGDNLAGTEYDIDYVYYGQNAEQKAAAQEYYANAPKLEGLHDITMYKGQTPDLLKDVTTSDGYFVDFSIENEPMFQTKGGLTKVELLCSGKDDLSKLAQLPVGQYNIHYTAIPNNVEYVDGNVKKETDYKFNRKTATLIVKEAVKTDKLDTLINDVEKFLENKDQYNANAIKALEEKLAAAKELLKQNPTQEQIDAMVKELQAVYDVAKDSKNGPLIPLEPSKPIIPLTPLEPSKPVVPLTPLEPSKPVVPLTPLEPSKPVVPLTPLEESKPVVQTGDTTMMTAYAMVLIGAVATVMMLRKKREN